VCTIKNRKRLSCPHQGIRTVLVAIYGASAFKGQCPLNCAGTCLLETNCPGGPERFSLTEIKGRVHI